MKPEIGATSAGEGTMSGMEKVHNLGFHPGIPLARMGKYCAYVSEHRGPNVRSVSADFSTEAEAVAALPGMRQIVSGALDWLASKEYAEKASKFPGFQSMSPPDSI